jgi:hypothetical protein
LPGGKVEQTQGQTSRRWGIDAQSFILRGPFLNLNVGVRGAGVLGRGRKNLSCRGVRWKVQVVITKGIIFVRAIKACFISDGRLESGDFIGIPPGVVHQKMGQGDGKKQKKSEPSPSAALLEGAGEKTGADEGKDGHPAPGKLNEAKFWQEVPERSSEAEHERCGRGSKNQKREPGFPTRVARIGEGGEATGD